ncbi:hydrogenase maturation nickel metallochaperone HypA/HybF [Sulfurospirillum oryzae]|uniref:hydrogenase maturation nickel metallochaperone HypA/HybF n=1 Tax=Sulfurospirillum oryzae TaxID=2976535 RepID=UPI0021E99EC4|nr:hydrogenase maturation nickel metallochaperone HypA [Sulfurospirillum oryzae]
MHEYTIVASLIDLCEKEAKKHHAKAIKHLQVSVGRLSGIEIHFLEQCFDTFKEETICHDATLSIELCDVVLLCSSCHEKSVVSENHFICPKCYSEDVAMIGGQELHVKSIEIIEE